MPAFKKLEKLMMTMFHCVKITSLTFLMALFLMLGAFQPSFAQEEMGEPSLYSEEEKKTLADIEAYLEGLDTLKARFRQTAEVYARELTGTFYLDKPGKLRFEYDDPIDDYIVADGRFIYFYDSELESASQSFIGSTLADFLVREDPNLLAGDIEVMDIQRNKKQNLLGLTVRQREAPDAGRLTLIFTTEPTLELQKWQVVDARGYITQIELDDIEKGLTLDDDLFTYVNPDILEPSYN